MDHDTQPNHVGPPPLPDAPRPRRRVLAPLLKTLAVLVTLGLGIMSYEIISSGTSPREVFRQIGRLITSRDRLIQGEAEGRINVLLLGVGGSGHDGPLLTDSMLLVSFRPTTEQLALISIPRDLQVQHTTLGERRINSIYALTAINQPGAGSPAIRASVSEVFGVPIHYSLLLDFSGFTELVDELGGITVEVEHPLDDEFYPVAGKEQAADAERYEHLYIPAGRQHLDGELALKYVRSRKAKGVQGSDFARSHRQQQVLTAVRDKLTGFGSLRPGRISDLLRIAGNHVDTNLEAWELLRLYQLGKSVDPQQIIRHVLDDRPDGLLVASTVGGAYMLVPRGGNYQQLQAIAADPFRLWSVTQPLPDATAATNSPAPTPVETRLPPPTAGPRLQIHNGTPTAGLAARTEDFLRRQGFSIISVGNAPIQTYLKTVVYDLHPPAFERAVRGLGQTFNAVTFASGPPELPYDEGSYPLAANADILIILGRNAEALVPEK